MVVHTSKNYEEELENLRTRVMTMGGRVESQVRLAILAYSEGDTRIAQQVLDTEREINKEQLSTDQMCSEVIARRQPAAKDLRLLLGVIRTISDLRNEKIGFKIRERTLERIPYLLVLGDREVEEGTVNVRTRSGTNLGTMSIDAFIDLVKTAVAERGRYIVE